MDFILVVARVAAENATKASHWIFASAVRDVAMLSLRSRRKPNKKERKKD